MTTEETPMKAMRAKAEATPKKAARKEATKATPKKAVRKEATKVTAKARKGANELAKARGIATSMHDDYDARVVGFLRGCTRGCHCEQCCVCGV